MNSFISYDLINVLFCALGDFIACSSFIGLRDALSLKVVWSWNNISPLKYWHVSYSLAIKCKKIWSFLLAKRKKTKTKTKQKPQCFLFFKDQWCCSGDSTRLLAMEPGFDSQIRRLMWVEFVGSLLCGERFFSKYSGFTLYLKPNISLDLICVNFNLQCSQLVCLKDK